GPDLWIDTQNAVRYMIDWLKHEHGLDDHEALILCSVAMDLKISETVDAPNWIVSACMPLGIFRG
ncbi:MAG: acetamidase/formamidase family protein, partial [Chloroflexia bacterium]|nr:acetamidase/formamidase family protein [Chloroflexia bacterium]